MASEEGPLPERPVTLEELSKANGESGHPLYVAIKDPFSSKVTVFDVSAGSAFYGPGNPYHVFAAKDATYGLATTSTDPEKLIGDLSNLTQSQKDTHMQWHAKFASKYPIIGYLVHASEDDTSSAVTTDTKKDV